MMHVKRFCKEYYRDSIFAYMYRLTVYVDLYFRYLHFQASLASWVTLLRIMGDLPETDASEGISVPGVGIYEFD